MLASIPHVIIVAGPPGTGKTVLIDRLAARIPWPVMTKDAIKESLFDSLGCGDAEWSMRLSRAGLMLLRLWLETEVAVGRSCIIEANFDGAQATGEFREIMSRYPFHPVQIQCWAEPEVLVKRLWRRAARRERHPGHIDWEWAPLLTPETVTWRTEPIDIGGVLIELDTTDFDALDYDGLLDRIEAAIS
ncbi:MAG TPA: ATP-binding protein [Chloroflexi bacterium]|nr:ATP-binding protein [Chloroflexota bacterium]